MSELRIITKDELVEIVRKHALWLADEDVGERANLSCANLHSADLRFADLSSANLSSANLRFANLSSANLRFANLSSADLRFANLHSADLRFADLSSANLRSANLRFANLSSANLSSADLRFANLRFANLQLVGQDIRGYLFWSFANEDGVVVLSAGCREFVGIAAARQHWTSRHIDDVVLHADCLSLVDRCEQMAKVRGWKLEAE